MEKETVKPRKERRKEARLAKRQRRLESWTQYRISKKCKREESMLLNSSKAASDNKSPTLVKKSRKSENNINPNAMPPKCSKLKASTSVQLGKKFGEYVEMEKNGAAVSINEDLALEMHLVKKLKVKEGRVSVPDYGIDDKLDGMFVNDSSEVASHGKELSLGHNQEIKYVAAVNLLKTTGKSKLKDEQPKNDARKSSKLKNKQQEHVKAKVESLKKPKTKFEEYLQLEGQKTVSADEDLALEQRLAKKLKVKKGKLGGFDDGLNDLIDGICLNRDFVVAEPEIQTKEKNKKKKKSLSGKSSDTKSKLSKPLKGSNSEKDYFFQSGTGSSEMSVEEDTVFHDAKEEHMKLDEFETFVEVSEKNESKVSKAKGLGKANFIPKGDAANTKADQQHNVANSLVKYVAPHLRSNLATDSAESVQTGRHIRGLLNRLSESNVESIAAEVSTVFQSHGRRLAAEIVGDEVLASCANGPRGNEQYAAVFAAFVSGIAASVGMDFGAKLLASLATLFEEKHREEDGLSLRNITLLLAYLYMFGLCSSDLIYDLLELLSKRLEELDVSTILTILQCCGMNLRSDDPVAMKDFIVDIQQHIHELKALPSGTQEGKSKINGKRMEFMLETICEIKNNKKRSKEDSKPHIRLKKWLQKLRVEDVQLRGVKWNKLLDPDKKGQWWLSGDVETTGKDPAAEIADVIDAEVAEAQKMLHLASAQRMNTEARRAIFCIIMSGEDYLDAFEKILRLNLPGKQDREILRVLVECCLQEKVFNKYYSLLAAKLCHHDKNHKFSLQYCLWDHFKQLDLMEVRRLANLARFLADLIGSFSLSLSVLKAVDFTDSAVLTSKVVMHFRILFETLFRQCSDNVIWNIFTRIASPPELENLRIGLELFIHQHVNKIALTGEQLDPSEGASVIVSKSKVAKKAVANVAGVLL